MHSLDHALHRQVGLFTGYGMYTAFLVLRKEGKFCLYIIIKSFVVRKQWFHFFCHFHIFHLFLFTEHGKQLCQLFKVTGISCCKCNAFPMLGRHIQCIIPVCSTQSHMVVTSHLIEAGQILYQNMFQNSSGIFFLKAVFLYRLHGFLKIRIQLCSSGCLPVFEIGLAL